MAVYSKLLLSTGGGIISSQQQADQAKGQAAQKVAPPLVTIVKNGRLHRDPSFAPVRCV